MRKSLLLFCFLISSSFLFGQEIHGTITDEKTGEPLLNVAVFGPEKSGTVSDINGHFSLSTPVGKHPITFSLLGYDKTTIVVAVADENTSLELKVSLKPQSISLETVVVSAGKFEQKIEETTISLEVIKPTLINEKNTYNMQDVLQQTPGVNVSEDQVNIRSGSGWSFGAGSRVLMMVDDMPLMSPDAGQIQWKLLPNEAVHQMEIIKGATSALYGTSAMNGLINTRTVVPTVEPSTEVALFGGFYDAPERASLKWWDGTQSFVGMNFLHAQKIKTSEIAFSGMLLKDEGFQYGVVDNRARFNLKTQFFPQKAKGLSWGFHASALYSEGGDALLWWDFDNAYIPADSSATRSNGWDYYIDPFVSYKKGRGKHQLKGRYMSINNNARTEEINYENFSDYFYGEYQYQHFFEHELTITAGLVGALGYSDSEVFGGHHESKNGATYLQVDKKWSKLVLSAGIRYEAYTLDDRNWSTPVLRAGLNYQLWKATFLRGSFGQGYRFPSMAETFTNTLVGSTGVLPNLELEPESGWTAELAIKQGFKLNNTWKGFFDLAGFINHFDNMTEFSFAQWGGIIGFKSVNVGPTEITGIEATVTSTGKIKEVDLRILTGYAYTRPISLDPDGTYATSDGNFELTYSNTSSDPTNNILKYRYQHLFKLDVLAEYKGFGLGASIKYNDFMQNIDKIFEASSGSIEVFPGVKESREVLSDGDLLFDARLYYQFTRFRVSLIIDNLTNQEYLPRPSNMGPPRKFTFKLNYKI